jgi:hypothetical protein
MPDDSKHPTSPTQGAPTPARRAKRQSTSPKQKSRQPPRWAELSNLFSEPYDGPFGPLRLQAEASLGETVIGAERRLHTIVHNSFRIVDGGRR